MPGQWGDGRKPIRGLESPLTEYGGGQFGGKANAFVVYSETGGIEACMKPNLPQSSVARSKQRYLLQSILALSVALVFLSCNKDGDVVGPTTGYQYQVPPETSDGWQTASLASVGMDQTPLVALMNTLHGMNDHSIHSLLIVKEGKLVFEEYFPGEKFNLAEYTGETGFDRDDTHNLCSATKSVTSALIGIAIDKGYIQSVDQKVFDFFPEYSDLLTASPAKNDMTVRHLLTMTSGLQWDDVTYSYFDPRNDMNQLFNRRDPIRYILSKNLIETPGKVFAYRNCNTNVLGEIIRKATLQRLDTFAEIHLFSELGITDYEWQMLRNDVVFCSGDLRLRPRDMAKFGLLFLDGGTWDGKRIVSQRWIEESTKNQIDPDNHAADFGGADGYGYQWWVWEDIDGVKCQAYCASGWGGQWIIVCPSMNTVVVSTAGNYYSEAKMSIQSILVHYVIPSVFPGEGVVGK